MHNDKHCIKMILEYAQLLSTVHRVIDGKELIEKRMVQGSFPVRWRQTKIWRLNDDRDSNIYSATHINHPSAIWARDCSANYLWLVELWLELMQEYTYRYGKAHACEKLIPYLTKIPNNICTDKVFSGPTPAMPDDIKLSDSLSSYRNYYVRSKTHLASWKGKVNGRDTPLWYRQGCLDLMAEDAQAMGLYY